MKVNASHLIEMKLILSHLIEINIIEMKQKLSHLLKRIITLTQKKDRTCKNKATLK